MVAVISEAGSADWVHVVGPAIALAIVIGLDNKYIGPYFPILDVVFNEFGTGYSWHDKEILWSLARRFFYVVVSGALLDWVGYSFGGVISVFFVTGILMIWPALFHPLPVYANKSDLQVLLVWCLYVVSIVAAGAFGARVFALIRALSGQSTWEFARGLLVQAAVLGVASFVFTAFRIPLQERLWNRGPKGSSGDARDC